MMPEIYRSGAEDYRTAAEGVIYLAGCAVREEKPDAERIREMNTELLYRAAEAHMLTAAVGMALESAGIRDARFVQETAKAQRKNALLDHDRAEVLRRMEEAGIWYMPLKGAVIGKMYPRFGMRQMADNDILADAGRAEDVRGIMKDLGFAEESQGKGHHDTYSKPPVGNFEIHRTLFDPPDEKAYAYYRNVKDRLIRDEGTRFGYHFSAEDFYVYMTIHAYKHFSAAGTGLRSLLDVYVFFRTYGEGLDTAYIEEETKKLGADAFEKQSRRLALKLFEGKEAEGKARQGPDKDGPEENPLTPEERDMLAYMLYSGTYGTYANSVRNKVRTLGGGRKGKLRYLTERLFIPMETVKSAYPFINRNRMLYPLFVVFRIGKGIVCRPGMIAEEIRTLIKMKE